MFVFDAYGTLLDVDSAAREAAAEPGMEALKENWLPIAKGWRERQLRYSWLCSMMGKYDDFWELTIRALDTTLEEHALASNDKVRARFCHCTASFRLIRKYQKCSPISKRLVTGLQCSQMLLPVCW